ncbi:MAG: putative zinc-binding peptidase [Panacibacter sp.]
MKLFKCINCGQSVYFENTQCINCGLPLGFETEMLETVALNVENNGIFCIKGNNSTTQYRYCNNYIYDVCNWLVPATSGNGYCKACELNRTIPDLGKTEYGQRWRKIENAKHRLIYQLLRMKLPLVSKQQDGYAGLIFDFMADDTSDKKERVMTGHDDGVITINIAEADDIEREMARKKMDEVYRTLLGHFRHEIGHYYWDRLIAHTNYLQGFRNVFGNDNIDYATALKNYYENATVANWNEHYISAYATMHPWEDWAETWAHYMHIIDTLETAYAFGLSVRPIVDETKKLDAEIKRDPYAIKDFETIIQLWLPLTFAMNSLNRSMGLLDIYPFLITPAVKEKMKFIHEVVMNESQRNVQ